MIVMVVVIAAGCRPGHSARQRSAGEGGDAKAPADRAATEPAPAARCAGGRPWDGAPTGCAYEHDGCCYATAELACAAASCEAAACEVLETYPAQIRCRGR